MKTILMLAGVLTLGACAAEQAAPTPLPDGPDQCRAGAYQRFVGQNRSALPAQPAGENWRVVCSTCAVTMDYSPSRLNIIYDTQTNIIREVKCG